MADYDNNKRGVLFRNEKGDNPKRPDMTGNLEIDGVKYRVSAWEKTSQRGNQFLSFVVSEDDGPAKNTGNGVAAQKPQAGQQLGIDDDVPF